MLSEDIIEVEISDVSITNVGFAIFIKPVTPESKKVVPVFIGPLETYSISSALEGTRPPRPNTHDIIINMIQELDAKIKYIIINDVIGSIYYARIVIESAGGPIEMDARPSDSIAIAIRAKCPMYMQKKVYEDSAVIINEQSDESVKNDPEESQDKAETKPLGNLERYQNELKIAVENENFEKAAILRDKIEHLQREN